MNVRLGLIIYRDGVYVMCHYTPGITGLHPVLVHIGALPLVPKGRHVIAWGKTLCNWVKIKQNIM